MPSILPSKPYGPGKILLPLGNGAVDFKHFRRRHTRGLEILEVAECRRKI